jgi:sulfate transport system ATP-binding protein
VIAGLERPDEGQTLFGGRDVTATSAAERRVGFVFQQYALFAHMTVARNVSFALDVRRRANRPSKAAIASRVADLLKLVELDGLEQRMPGQLSGGQGQRVALARALAADPKVLLLDEPFGALDATVRRTLRKELRRIHDTTGLTTVFVTHDQEEAMELADRVAVLNQERIEQIGTPQAIYDHPASAFVCGFVGEANRFDGVVSKGRFESGSVSLEAKAIVDGPAVAFVRPHDLAPARTGVAVTLKRIAPQGPLARLEGHTSDGQAIEALIPREAADYPGAATVTLTVKRAHIFPKR